MSNIFRMRRLTNFKLGTQTQHEDPHQRQAQWSSRSKVKVARSRDASDRCWQISRERNVLGRPKLVGRLSTPRAIMHPRFKVKGQKSRSPGRLMLRPEVRHIFRTGRPTNFKLGTEYTKTRISDKRSDLQGQRSRSQGNVTRLIGVGR